MKIIGECEGCHKEKEIINIGGDMPFCKSCMNGIPKRLCHRPKIIL